MATTTFKPGILIILFFLFSPGCFSQASNLYIPVTINSPLFAKNKTKELQFGSKINNYGLHLNFAGQSNNKVLIFSIQQNNGHLKFDPLNFNEYFEKGQEIHLIQTYPSRMLYCELGAGYDFKTLSQKLTVIAGGGQQFYPGVSRVFVQFDWGNEGKLINAGFTIRGNYKFEDFFKESLFTLEPAIQGKVKFWKLRLFNQFGYSLAIKKDHDYMKPFLTVGLEYIL